MTNLTICQSPIQDGLPAGATAKVAVTLPHGCEIGLASVFIAVRTLGGAEGALLAAFSTHPHDGLVVTVRNEGAADAGHYRVDALIVGQ